jgi:hypothetical protein
LKVSRDQNFTVVMPELNGGIHAAFRLHELPGRTRQ